MESQNPVDKVDPDDPELDGSGIEKPDTGKTFEIQIDRTMYTLTENRLTGADLRRVPDPPIPPERDLFEIIPGHPDRKVEVDDRIVIRDGLRFFTAPNTINPGVYFIGG
ncbi:MAG: multiubiquitin domain-containing protein [Dehalococcoidia bacterium]|nr:multiubiquitin domain-containing protein [Dehalococcoidia bacterium]